MQVAGTPLNWMSTMVVSGKFFSCPVIFFFVDWILGLTRAIHVDGDGRARDVFRTALVLEFRNARERLARGEVGVFGSAEV